MLPSNVNREFLLNSNVVGYANLHNLFLPFHLENGHLQPIGTPIEDERIAQARARAFSELNGCSYRSEICSFPVPFIITSKVEGAYMPVFFYSQGYDDRKVRPCSDPECQRVHNFSFDTKEEADLCARLMHAEGVGIFLSSRGRTPVMDEPEITGR
jgi:hypothetical protein